jgi:pilus assembly protein Flp/PilA
VSTFIRFSAEERAATAIEYGLIAAGIALANIVAVQNAGAALKRRFHKRQHQAIHPLELCESEVAIGPPSGNGQRLHDGLRMATSPPWLAPSCA